MKHQFVAHAHQPLVAAAATAAGSGRGLASTPDLASTSCNRRRPTRRSERRSRFFAAACSSSCLRATLWEPAVPSPPPAARVLERASSASSSQAGAPGNQLAAQLLLRDSSQQRILPMELLQMLMHCFQLLSGPGGIQHPEMRRFATRSIGGSRPAFSNIRFEPTGARHQLGHSDAVAGFGGQQRDAFGSGAAFSRIRKRSAPPRFGAAISSTTPPPMVTTGENIRTMKRSPGSSSQRLAQEQADVIARAGSQRFGSFETPDLGFHLRRASVKMNRRAMLQRFGRGQQIKCAVDLRGGVKPAALSQHHAAGQLGHLHACQVQSRPLSGRGLRERSRHAPGCRARARAGRRETAPLPAPAARSPKSACR